MQLLTIFAPLKYDIIIRMNNMINLIKKIILIFVLACISLACAKSKTKLYPEQRIYLWDVTGSLLPNEKGVKDAYNGESLPQYGKGNGLWNALKTNLINSIASVEEDGLSEIVIVPFYTHVLGKYRFSATKEGKHAAIEFVSNKKYEQDGECKTNLVAPIEAAYSLLKKNYVNYVFVFTDGDNEIGDLSATLGQWNNKTQRDGQWTFGFYILVDPIANTHTVNHAAATQKNFFIVNDAKQIVHLVQMPASMLSYNIQTDQQDTITLSGNYENAIGDVQLFSTNNYYDVVSVKSPISSGKLVYSLKPKVGVDIPVTCDIEITANLTGQDSYTFQTIRTSNVRVFNRRENVIRFEPIKKK